MNMALAIFCQWPPYHQILSYAGDGHKKRSGSLPSLVPDWRLYESADMPTPFDASSALYRASQDWSDTEARLAEVKTVERIEDSFLTTKGVAFDHIVAVDPEGVGDSKDDTGTPHRFGFGILGDCSTMYPPWNVQTACITSHHHARQERRYQQGPTPPRK